jgi:hypothetical protein
MKEDELIQRELAVQQREKYVLYKSVCMYAVVIMCKHFVEYFSNAYAYKVALKPMKLHS